MKNLFAALLITLSVSTATTSFASTSARTSQGKTEQANTASVTLSQTEKSKLDVVVEKAANPKMTVRLVDASGNNIATKSFMVSETGTRIRFDLAALSDGEYQIKLSDGKTVQLKKFELKTETPTIASQKLYIL